MNTTTTPVITVDAGLPEALWANFVAPVLSGEQGFVEQAKAAGADDVSLLVPIGAVTHDLSLDGGRFVYAELAGRAALAIRWAERDPVVWVRARDRELLAKAVAEVASNLPVPPEDHRIEIDFLQVGHHPYTTPRRIAAPPGPTPGTTTRLRFGRRSRR